MGIPMNPLIHVARVHGLAAGHIHRYPLLGCLIRGSHHRSVVQLLWVKKG